MSHTRLVKSETDLLEWKLQLNLLKRIYHSNQLQERKASKLVKLHFPSIFSFALCLSHLSFSFWSYFYLFMNNKALNYTLCFVCIFFSFFSFCIACTSYCTLSSIISLYQYTKRSIMHHYTCLINGQSH